MVALSKRAPRYTKCVVCDIRPEKGRVTLCRIRDLGRFGAGERDGTVRYVDNPSWEKAKFHVPRMSVSFKHQNLDIMRTQYPLALGYSYSVHKVQGQTLNKCVVDLDNDFFAHGQLYVALTRCRHSKDLMIMSSAGDFTAQNICLRCLIRDGQLDTSETSSDRHEAIRLDIALRGKRILQRGERSERKAAGGEVSLCVFCRGVGISKCQSFDS